MRKWNTVLLHLSLLVILSGALLTHLTSFSGTIHLRQGESVNSYSEMVSMTESKNESLPFVVRLDRLMSSITPAPQPPLTTSPASPSSMAMPSSKPKCQ